MPMIAWSQPRRQLNEHPPGVVVAPVVAFSLLALLLLALNQPAATADNGRALLPP